MADDDDRDHDRARRAFEAGEVLPLRAVLDAVERDVAGELLEVELERDHGRWIYEVKLLAPSGSVVKLYYDATDATLLRARGHDLERGDR